MIVPLWCARSAVITRKCCSFAMHSELPNDTVTRKSISPRSLSIANSRFLNENCSWMTPSRMPECNQTSKHCFFSGKQKQWQASSRRNVSDSWCCRSIRCIMKARELPQSNRSRCVDPSEARKIDSLLCVRIVKRFSDPLPTAGKWKQVSSALKIFTTKIANTYNR